MIRTSIATVLSAAVYLSSFPAAATITGSVAFINAEGDLTRSYQRGDEVALQLTDADLNTNTTVAETVTVLVTSQTENEGTPASVTELQADSGNVGTGLLSVTLTGDDVTAQNWELLAISASEFLVTGSVSGQLDSRLSVYSMDYVTPDGELVLSLSEGDVGFKAGDKFTFSTVSATVTGETITLTETAADSGVFSATVSTNTDGVATADNGVLDLVSGDRLRVRYTDAQGDWGGEEVVEADAFYATTVLSGRTLNANTVWTAEDSPYLIMGDVTVAQGKSLTLMPGVEVLFLAGSDDTLGGEEAQKSELIVGGPLTISGRADAPVILRSSEAEGEAGDWGGIKLQYDGRADISYMQLHHSSYGLLFKENTSNYLSPTISDSVISHSGQGVRVESCYGCSFSITNSQFDEITNYAVKTYAYDGQITMLGNVITGGQGIYTSYESVVKFSDNTIADVSNVQLSQIRNNLTFTGNEIARVYSVPLEFYSDSNLSDIVIENNTISARSGAYSGLQISLNTALVSNRFSIAGNTISGFGNYYNYGYGDEYYDGYGLYIYSDKNVTPDIRDNQLIDNPGIGLYTTGKVLPTLTGNTITGNGAGVYIDYNEEGSGGRFSVSENDISDNQGYGLSFGGNAEPQVQYNDLVGNGGYALSNQTGNDIDAKYNWWGEAATQEIEGSANPKNVSFINDSYDNLQYGGVNYASFATSSYADVDGDGVNDAGDNCPAVANPDQADFDRDGMGNLCDADLDGDGIVNNLDTDNDNDGINDDQDAFPYIAVTGYTDSDTDGAPDTCDSVCRTLGMSEDLDDDNDGISDEVDLYPLVAITGYTDTDQDGAPDDCNDVCQVLGMAADLDDDNDGIADTSDAYPLTSIGELKDTDQDGIPDTCDEDCQLLGMAADEDDDNDGVVDEDDSYPLISLNGLVDTDQDGIPNDCNEECIATGMQADTDDDNDGLLDTEELVYLLDPLLVDSDGDGIADADELFTVVGRWSFTIAIDQCAEAANPIIIDVTENEGYLQMTGQVPDQSQFGCEFYSNLSDIDNNTIVSGLMSDAQVLSLFAEYVDATATAFTKQDDERFSVEATTETGATLNAEFARITDIVAPVISVPDNLVLPVFSETEVYESSHILIRQFLLGVTALDDVDGVVVVTNDMPTTLPIGDTVVTFKAIDQAGNEASQPVTITISTDVDNDGYVNWEDVFISNGAIAIDTDGDGLADDYLATCDVTCQSKLTIDNDDDNDGIPDVDDALPTDPRNAIARPSTEGELVKPLGNEMATPVLFSYEPLYDNYFVKPITSQHTVTFSGQYRKVWLYELPDMDGNGAPEYGLLGIRSDNGNEERLQLFIRDSFTGNRVSVLNWVDNWSQPSILILDDITGDGVADIGMQGYFKQGFRPQLVVKDSLTNASIATYSFPNLWENPQYMSFSDVTSDGTNEVAMFGKIKRNGKFQVKVVDGKNRNNRLKAYNFPANWTQTSWHNVGDYNGDGQDDWGLLGQAVTDNRWQLTIKDGTNPRGVEAIYAWPDMQNVALMRLSDMNDDGIKEFALGGLNTSDRWQLQIKDGQDRNNTFNNITWPNKWDNTSLHVIGDVDGDAKDEVALLGKGTHLGYDLVIKLSSGDYKSELTLQLDQDWFSKPIISQFDIDDDGVDEWVAWGAIWGTSGERETLAVEISMP